MKTYVRLAIGLVLVAGLFAWLVAPEGESLGMVGALAFIFGLSLLAARPRSRAFGKAHPRAVRTAGVAFIVATFGVIAVPIIWPELGLSSDLSVGVAVGCMVCAAVLITLPTSANQMDALKTLQERSGATPFDPVDSGPAEALRALRFVRDHPLALARIVLPWGLIGIGVLVAGVYGGASLLQAHSSRAAGASVLVMLGLTILIMVISYPMTALAWARYVAGHAASPFSPVRASGAYLWRFFVISMTAHTLSKQLAPAAAYLTARLGLADPKSLDGLLLQGGYLVILLIFGPMALVLPAIAVGDSRQTSSLVTGLFRPGRRYVLGLILAAAPFLAVNVIVEITTAFLPQIKSLSSAVVLAIVPMLATYLGIATVMTYLTRVYLKVTAETDIGTYEPFVAEASE